MERLAVSGWLGGENLNLIIFVVIPGSLLFDFLPLGGVAMVVSLSAMFMSGGGFAVARKGWDSTVMVETRSIRKATYVARYKITKTFQLH